MTLNSCRGFPLFAYYRKTTKKEVCKHILRKKQFTSIIFSGKFTFILKNEKVKV